MKERTAAALILMCSTGLLSAPLGCGSDADAAGSGVGASSAGGAGAGGNGVASGSGAGGDTTPGWQSLPALQAGPRQETAVVSLNEEVYVLGGFDEVADILPLVEVYTPATASWRYAAPLPEPRHHINAAAAGGKLYVLGGLLGHSFSAEGSSWVYDPVADTWSGVEPMPKGSERGGGLTVAIGNKIYVVGGYRLGAVSDVSVYDITADSWQALASQPEPLDHLMGGAVAGRVFAIGGRDGSIEGIVSRVDVYDPKSDAWAPAAALPTARGGAAAAVIDSLIYVLGGEGNQAASNGVFADVEVYDTTTDSWQHLAPMKTPRHGTGAAAVNGVVYVPGGATQQAFGAVDTHEAYKP